MSKFDYVVNYELKTGNVLIYGLVCPIKKQIVYVGSTKNVLLRMYAHFGCYYPSNIKKEEWENSLKKMNLQPSVVFIEQVPAKDRYTREIEWMQFLRYKWFDLVNRGSLNKKILYSIVPSRVDKMNRLFRSMIPDPTRTALIKVRLSVDKIKDV